MARRLASEGADAQSTARALEGASPLGVGDRSTKACDADMRCMVMRVVWRVRAAVLLYDQALRVFGVAFDVAEQLYQATKDRFTDSFVACAFRRERDHARTRTRTRTRRDGH